MKNYETLTLKAKKLIVDDYFKVGGQMCRIIYVRKDANTITVTLQPISEKVISYSILTLSHDTFVKVYNQKY